jgi:hypothetical protein
VETNTYLESNVSLPNGLAGQAVIIKRNNDHRVSNQQDLWIKPLQQLDVAELAIKHEEPHCYWREIIEVVAEIGTSNQMFRDKLRETSWLPTLRGAPVKPEDVVLLPEIDEELVLLSAQEGNSYLPPSQLSKEIQEHGRFEDLRGLFSSEEEGLGKLSLLLEGKIEYHLGSFEVEGNEDQFKQHLAMLELLPGYLSFPGWQLLSRLSKKYNLFQLKKYIFPILFFPVERKRLFELLLWIKEEHDKSSKNDKLTLLALYNWTLIAFVQSTDAHLLLHSIFLSNKEGHWHRADELCVNVVGIARRHILDEEQRNILWLQMSVGHVKSACYEASLAILYQYARPFPLSCNALS